jgi:hypothetical protein
MKLGEVEYTENMQARQGIQAVFQPKNGKWFVWIGEAVPKCQILEPLPQAIYRFHDTPYN